MGWLGAGLGAGIGMMVGGPIGACIGAGIGSELDSEEQLVVVCPHCDEDVEIESEGEWTCPNCNASFTYGDVEENQIVFIVALCSMLAKMAKADGVVCKEEIATITNFFDEMDLDSEDKKEAIKIFNNAKTDGNTIYEYAQQYSEIADDEMREIIYAALWDVANADGEIHQNEDIILRSITGHLGIPESKYDEFNTQTRNDPSFDINQCYETLDCSENDSDQMIKQKYRKVIAEYHPDKIQSKGLPEGFIKFANEQVQKINSAYEIIRKHRKNT